MREPALVPRLQPFTSTIFAEMTALAVSTGAVNLGQGFPDTDGPAAMLDAAKDALFGGANQYPPGPGRPELRRAISAHRARYGLEYDPDGEILVTAGATEAIAASLLALTEPGDEVIVIEPYYDSYAASVALAGATRRVVSLVERDGRFALDTDAVRAAITPKTRAILVNSPHNPTGTVFTRAELTALAGLCVEHDLLVITDEVYEHLVFDDAEHLPLATFPGMRERTVGISSAGKTFNCTGWKIGWVCSTPELVAAVKAAKQFMTFVSGGPLQPAVAYALEHELDWVERLRTSLSGKRDRLAAGLAEAGFAVRPSAGTYFICADVRPLGFTDAAELAWQLPERVGVAAVPVKVFTDHPDEWQHVLRFAFCKRDEVLDEAIQRLHKLST
ncbi:pyridoxal phosphate-dependent aminotransferase [Amycolatopsis magusensis]|uniref:N-succinyldiaminopimelate aminotransferase n=1 Tax=Amycolatopsis magusensis TaxID=882444 RepID=A0ABS4PL87_9PSEU|nr:pyridoxal phosphate-dependent aminotransferase [Amycolatopsis magusensis]MBP2180196.1 N-succinyldiaminopimelate aminotransferase [Amycolatopsis magusensis]MDI5976265.1 pyridoxal phosphate-dependent aminotransferase [Amycolatopsis magusensis]